MRQKRHAADDSAVGSLAALGERAKSVDWDIDDAGPTKSRWTWLQYTLAGFAAVPLVFVGGLSGWPWESEQSQAAVTVPTIGADDPVRVEYPRLGIDAGLDGLGLAGGLSAPRHGRLGWLVEGPEPGDQGRAVVLGHVIAPTGDPDVFAGLAKARAGDRITVTRADGRNRVFVVEDKVTYRAADLPAEEIYAGDDSVAELALIAPAGTPNAAGEYPSRVVVLAEAEG